MVLWKHVRKERNKKRQEALTRIEQLDDLEDRRSFGHRVIALDPFWCWSIPQTHTSRSWEITYLLVSYVNKHKLHTQILVILSHSLISP